MKRLVAVAMAFASMPAFAGISYDFRTSTTGISSQTIAGAVQAEGKNIRIDVETGDGVLFQSGSFVVSSDGGQTMRVANPSDRTWYQLNLSEILGGGDALLKQLGGAVNLEVRNPKVSVSGGTDAGALEGFPAKKSTVQTGYELALSGLGQPMTMTMAVTSDVWWTDKIAPELTNFLQMRGLRTGVDAVDKLIAAQTDAIKGFPLKQVTTTTISFSGRDMTTTSTSTVSNVKQAAVAASAFTIPAGFEKTASPVEKMFGALQR
ncbi:MAG TPA: hypothetical protein VFT12_14770 [Thermoanaerobaculia bacterium]|nr:hypothetical protein [Thermoanaerobaculia bacterium]